MSTAALMDRIRRLPGVLVEEGGSAWTARLPKPGGVQFEVVVPKDVLEWFVTARSPEGTKIWSDWMDYAGYQRSENLEALAGELQRDVEWFVGTLATATEFRIQSQRRLWVLRHKVAEWNVGDGWHRISLTPDCAPVRNAQA